MGVASTVSRLPITVKVVPVSSHEEEGGGEQPPPQEEPEEEGSQQQDSQTQDEEEAAQTGNICFIHQNIWNVNDMEDIVQEVKCNRSF